MFDKKVEIEKSCKCILVDGIARMLKCCNSGVFRLGFLFRKSFNRWYRQAKYCACIISSNILFIYIKRKIYSCTTFTSIKE